MENDVTIKYDIQAFSPDNRPPLSPQFQAGRSVDRRAMSLTEKRFRRAGLRMLSGIRSNRNGMLLLQMAKFR